MKHYLERINREGVARVKMFFIVTIAYLLFWGPLFLVCIISVLIHQSFLSLLIFSPRLPIW